MPRFLAALGMTRFSHGVAINTPSTVNMYDAYHVVEDVVVDIWPVIPRGPGHHGLVAP